VHLSRQAGGIGTRGVGETQLETDKRLIRKRIGVLAERLEEIERERSVQRSRREAMPAVALVGYTNAGKSTLFERLTRTRTLVEDRLFATLDARVRRAELGDGLVATVADTVGFIRKLPHHLVASFRATLEETREADLLLHVADASHPDWEEQLQVVQAVLSDLGLAERPVLLVFNKMDAVADGVAFATRARALHPEAVFTTTMRTDGVESLKAVLRERAQGRRPTVRVLVPMTDGARLAAVYRAGEVIRREDLGTEVALTVRVEPWQAELLRNGSYPGAAQSGVSRTQEEERQ
jgi:GTP-binding protein HflX